MASVSTVPTTSSRALPQRTAAGFTLAEVLVAVAVLTLVISSAILAMQRGLHALDTARRVTDATQFMQSEIERLRLKNWAQLQLLQDSRNHAVPVPGPARSDDFRCSREIRDVKTDMKEIVLTATWRGVDGRPHSLRTITRYCRSGLNDYYYTVH
ncbi:MAG: type II secretion system protein [Opitutae bacterium]|nr:type II secretion system protein [Opitutae bacterium]